MLKIKRDNTHCAVPQCYSTGGKCPDLSFFRFPNAIYRENRRRFNTFARHKWNLQRRQLWITILRIGKEITERSVVCSKHFKETDFTRNGMRPRRLKPSALPSQCLPTSKPLEDEKTKRKKKQDKNSVSKARKIVKAGTIDASSKIQKTPPTDSSSRSVLNYRLIDGHKAPHLPTTNESNSFINISDSSVHSLLLEKEIKVEIPWEKEYNFIENFTNENERCDASDQDEVASTSSTLSVEDPENSMLDISTKKISQKKDSSSENIESRKITDRNEEKINNSIYSEESIKRKNEELSGSGRYFNIKKLEKCKIGTREETFGRFIACEMSDLSENPVLYLKTKQIILRALIDAHIELTNSYL